MSDVVKALSETIAVCNHALNDELSKKIVADVSDMVDSTPGDISSRYWLMEALNPLSRKQLKSVVDGFLVQLLNQEQAKKLVKFLLLRFPEYYSGNTLEEPKDEPKEPRVKPGALVPE